MTDTQPDTAPLLRVHNLTAGYGPAQALFGVSLDVPARSAVAVLGPNGAGKSTLARALSGLIPTTGGSVEFAGRTITGASATAIRRAGLVHLPEGRGIFPGLTVQENLRLALSVDKIDPAEAFDRAFGFFPALAERRKQTAGTLSGGEQQMLSLSRALMVNPRLVIADEMSLGLAPMLVDAVFDGLRAALDAGVAVIMIEQFAAKAIAFADHCLILQRGAVAWSGSSARAGGELLHRYLGAAGAGVSG
ncbi:ATP-binding cassette domain-containing protein [Gordonia pseudamarae]|uniref:ATP-binding cassette domain-containing protein n=1 Tax=Gordonia pseudamarae TaxID=2831662 RepID=A0ABX6IJ16_9ACTN|nr:MULTISPECIES: ABC transporter ATP-binding protein [Gordonia]MBD0022961.1 ABC transporter ATP-binding protein [Gordonia sp. (in: high G+C Gram-positive bacteria)]QHN26733.1 ATP-binding cassette domain-containing protein [Gordonia pseudamarae]QHN35626.1 ATP-binding cassette domain-containing protein [Gordonia pseudamarae]